MKLCPFDHNMLFTYTKWGSRRDERFYLFRAFIFTVLHHLVFVVCQYLFFYRIKVASYILWNPFKTKNFKKHCIQLTFSEETIQVHKISIKCQEYHLSTLNTQKLGVSSLFMQPHLYGHLHYTGEKVNTGDYIRLVIIN